MVKKLSTLLNVDFEYLVKGGTILGIGHVIGVLSGFLLSLIFANLVEVSTYGQYKYILSIAGILGAFTLSGVSTTVLQSVSKGFDGTLFSEQKEYLKWSITSVIIACFIGGYYIAKDDFILGAGIISVTFFSYVFNSLTLQGSFLSAKKDFRRLTLNQIANSLVLLVSIFFGIHFGLNSTLWIIFLYFCPQIIFQSATYFQMILKYKPGRKIDHEDKNLSKHLSLGNIITSCAEYLDKILIFQFFGPVQVASYAFAVGIPDQIRGVNKLLTTLIVPKLSQKSDTELTRSIYTHTKKYVVFSLSITALFYIFAPFIFAVFFPAYINVVNIASLYMLTFPITALSAMHGYGLQIKRDVKSLYIIRTIDSVGRIILFIILIPLYGVLGAVIAILIAKLLGIGLQFWFYHRKFR